MNALEPSAQLNKVISGKVPTLAFKIMEVINLAVNAMEKYGVPKTELFQTVDLYEGQNLNAVLIACSAVGRKVSMNRLSLNLVCQYHGWAVSTTSEQIKLKFGMSLNTSEQILKLKFSMSILVSRLSYHLICHSIQVSRWS